MRLNIESDTMSIWPELKTLLKETGIEDYSIFLDEETNILFGVLKIDNKLDWMNCQIILS